MKHKESYNVKGQEVTLNDIMEKAKLKDQMSEEELKELNEITESWTSQALRDVSYFLYDHQHIMEYAVKRYKELRVQKVEYPFWRCKGAIELILMETELPVKKFTQGFNIELGDTSKNLISIHISFDKQNKMHLEQWYRVFKKSVPLTPEEQEENNRKFREKQAKKREDQFKRNCSKWNLKPDILYHKFIPDDEPEVIYELIGCNPRNKKFPLKCRTYSETKEEYNGQIYDVTERYFKTMKEVK